MPTPPTMMMTTMTMTIISKMVRPFQSMAGCTSRKCLQMIQAQVKNVYLKARTHTLKTCSLVSERSQHAYYHSKQYYFAKQGSGAVTGARTLADSALDVDVDVD
jgi:hypothetical protein